MLAALARFETVDVLFLMSAYLLTLSYARAAMDGTPAARPARQFLFRRAVRILPLYWVGVTVVWAIRNPALPGDWVDLVEHLLVPPGLRPAADLLHARPDLVDEPRGDVLPAAGAARPRWPCAPAPGSPRRRRRAALLLGGTAAARGHARGSGTASPSWSRDVPFDNWPVYFGPQARFGAFAAGMALAVIVAARDGRPLFSGIWPGVLRLAGARHRLARRRSVAARAPGARSCSTTSPRSAGSCCWPAPCWGARARLWSRLLSWSGLTWLGLISYSTYMWHEPIMMLLEHSG